MAEIEFINPDTGKRVKINVDKRTTDPKVHEAIKNCAKTLANQIEEKFLKELNEKQTN